MTQHPSRSRSPRTLTMALAAASLLLLAGGGATDALAKAGAKLHGKWKATAMEVDGKRYPVKGMQITFEFKPGGTFVVVMSARGKTQTKKGTWSATASEVTMTVAGSKKTMPYKVKGDKLTMTKTKGGKRLTHHMQRVK